MRALVTGCAGFIGSHVAERFLAEGWSVTGIDAFTPSYARAEKRANLSELEADGRFTLIEGDLGRIDLAPVLRERPVVVHLAAQPGVRASFGDGFERYALDNLVATQRVFEAALAAGAPRVVWASSSSVYGDAAAYPCIEDRTPTAPVSPYGVTKRACEDLSRVARRRGLLTVGLRYFTVYGPRQRPDMAMRRLCEAVAGDGHPFPLYGDGSQSRDFTHVRDAADATWRAATAAEPSALYNVGGGHEATLAEVIATVQALAGRPVPLERHPLQTGDVVRTAADTARARRELGWSPAVTLEEGLASELRWVAGRTPASAPLVR